MSDARPMPRLLLYGLPVFAAAVLALIAAPATAHEHVTVDPYEFIVGWNSEPAVVDNLNGVDIHIIFHGPANSTQPVVGVESNLTSTLSSNGRSVVKAIEPQEGEPGAYTFGVIPSREGAYSVRVTGTINGTLINISVDMDAPVARADLEFPASDPTNEQLAQQLADAQVSLAMANANVTALSARVTAAEASAASASGSSAMLIALVALVLGAVGAGMGMVAWRAGKAKN